MPPLNPQNQAPSALRRALTVNSPHSSFSSAFALDLRQQAIHVAARDLLRMIYLADMDYPCSYTVRTGIPRRLFRIEVWRGASSNK
jgi:hypothetical protein